MFDTTVSLREAWALGRGVLDSQPEATFWAGSRFYDRARQGFGAGVQLETWW